MRCPIGCDLGAGGGLVWRAAIQQKIGIGHQQKIIARQQFQRIQIVRLGLRPSPSVRRSPPSALVSTPGNSRAPCRRRPRRARANPGFASLAGVGQEISGAGQPQVESRGVGHLGAIFSRRLVIACTMSRVASVSHPCAFRASSPSALFNSTRASSNWCRYCSMVACVSKAPGGGSGFAIQGAMMASA